MNEASTEKSERAIIMADFEAQTAFVDLRGEHKWGCRGKHGGEGGGIRRGPLAKSRCSPSDQA